MGELVRVDRLDWDEFVADFWDQRPVLVRGVDPMPFVETEVFAAAVRACEYEGGQAPNVSFTVADAQRRLDAGLPTAADGSFDGYEQRLAGQLDDRRYALIVSGFHSYDVALWDRERQFFRGLWDRVGLPLTGAITTLFHGNYDHSPVGVHKDRFATFMTGVREPKRMRFWPDRPWTEEVTTMTSYDRFRPTSFEVTVQPGDLLYWPSSYYHVGETAGSRPATSVNIGVPREEHHIRYEVEDLLMDLTPDSLVHTGAQFAIIAENIEAPARQHLDLTTRTLDPSLPPALRQALDTCRELPLAARATQISTRRWQAGGFEPVPLPNKKE
jgi:hypothetical protein